MLDFFFYYYFIKKNINMKYIKNINILNITIKKIKIK